MRRLVTAALGAAVRALAESIRRRAVRRAIESLDGCDFCPGPGDRFVDVTPRAKSMTARLACPPCADEAVRRGAVVLMGADGRPVTYGRH